MAGAFLLGGLGCMPGVDGDRLPGCWAGFGIKIIASTDRPVDFCQAFRRPLGFGLRGRRLGS